MITVAVSCASASATTTTARFICGSSTTSPRGEAYGDREGGVGGTGKPGDAGARGAWAVFGVINVPSGWRAALEVALIASEALSPGAAVKQAIGRGIRKLSVAQVRQRIKSQADAFAAAEVRRFREKFARALQPMDAKQREYLLRATRHYKQRQYFELVEQGARNRRMRLERKLGGKRGSKRQRDRLRESRTLEDAAKVKPVAGRLPRNHEYAGKIYRVDPRTHPDAATAIRGKRRAGVWFTDEGFPDFTPWTFKQGRVKADVRIQYQGKKSRDFHAARDAMRRKLGDPRWRPPPGHTWHHHEDVGRMVLVPTELHKAVPHTGGIPYYRMTRGDYDAYKQL